jgi:hypothetical protein
MPSFYRLGSLLSSRPIIKYLTETGREDPSLFVFILTWPTSYLSQLSFKIYAYAKNLLHGKGPGCLKRRRRRRRRPNANLSCQGSTTFLAWHRSRSVIRKSKLVVLASGPGWTEQQKTAYCICGSILRLNGCDSYQIFWGLLPFCSYVWSPLLFLWSLPSVSTYSILCKYYTTSVCSVICVFKGALWIRRTHTAPQVVSKMVTTATLYLILVCSRAVDILMVLQKNNLDFKNSLQLRRINVIKRVHGETRARSSEWTEKRVRVSSSECTANAWAVYVSRNCVLITIDIEWRFSISMGQSVFSVCTIYTWLNCGKKSKGSP